MTSVRPAVVDDAAAIAAVHVRTWQAAYAGVMPQSFLDGLDLAARTAMWRRSIDNGAAPGGVYVSEVDGELAGFIAVGMYRTHDGDRDPSFGAVYAIYVTPDRWSTGAGLALMREGVDHLSRHGLTEIRLWVVADNPRARRFYERFGFVADGETHVEDIGGRPVEELR